MGQPSGLMEAHLVADLALKERDYWWHRVRRGNLLAALRGRVPSGARVLEVGSGTGANLRALGKAGYRVCGIELDPAACAHCGDLPVFRADALKPWPLPDASFDAVVMLDVLEHLADPGFAVAEMHRVLKPGGTVCLMVPADPSLWSYWDEMLGHQRRYTPALLSASFAQGWQCRHLAFSFSWMAWPVRLVRAVNARRRKAEVHTDFVPLPALLNAVLVALGAMERHLSRWLTPPFGTTLQGVWQKSG